MASAKAGTVCVPLSMSAAKAAYARPTLKAGAPSRLVSAGHFCMSAAGMASSAGSPGPRAPAMVKGKISGWAASAVIRSVPSVPLISQRKPDTARDRFADVNAGGRPGGESADHRHLVDRRFHDLLPGLPGGDERPANRRYGRQVGELAKAMVERVQAVADSDREQVGPVVPVLQPDDGADPVLGGKRGHRSCVVEVAPERPLAVNGLAGRQRRGDELSMVRNLDRHGDDVDIGMGNQLIVVREDRRDSERLAGGARGVRAGRAECPDLVVRQRTQGRDVRGRSPTPGRDARAGSPESRPESIPRRRIQAVGRSLSLAPRCLTRNMFRRRVPVSRRLQ